MSCKSEILAVNTIAGTAIADGGTYVPTSVIRRFGQSVQLAGDGVQVSGAGYYAVTATATVISTAAAIIKATVLKDGAPIPGATASVSAAAGDVVTLPLSTMVRQNCDCDVSNITVQISGGATTSQNLSIRVSKE